MKGTFCALILLLSMQVEAVDVYTVEGGTACRSKELLNDFKQFAFNDDFASMQSYLQRQLCLILKGDLKVTPIDYPGMFTGDWVFVYNGIKFWANRPGLTFKSEATESKVATSPKPAPKPDPSRTPFKDEDIKSKGVLKDEAPVSLLAERWTDDVIVERLEPGTKVNILKVREFDFNGSGKIKRYQIDARGKSGYVYGWISESAVVIQ